MKRVDKKLIENIAKIKRLYLFLDYDGTLTPIVARPSRAKLVPGTRTLLKRLSSMTGVKIAIVSGRSLSDLERLVGVKRLDYVGNHGLERKVRGVSDIDPHGIRLRGFVTQFAREAKRVLGDIPGAMVENKIYSLSVHYRNVAPRDIPKARRAFMTVWNDFAAKVFFEIRPGKKILEIRPTQGCSDKGKAVQLLWKLFSMVRRKNMAVVYIGDDRTDEDAFRALGRSDFSIRVGRSTRTSARYWLRSPGKVAAFLKQLIETRKRIFLKNVPGSSLV